MELVARITDTDAVSLRKRVEDTLENDGGGECVVTNFTYWYTARPPVHEATVLRREAA